MAEGQKAESTFSSLCMGGILGLRLRSEWKVLVPGEIRDSMENQGLPSRTLTWLMGESASSNQSDVHDRAAACVISDLR